MSSNPLRDLISGPAGGFEEARANPLHGAGAGPNNSSPLSRGVSSNAGSTNSNARMARIAAAQSATKKSPMFTWKRAAIGAGVLALCAVVALTAGLAGSTSNSQSDNSAASDNSPANAAADSTSNADAANRVSVATPGASGGSTTANVPSVPTSRDNGVDNAASYATPTEVTALLSAYVDAPIAKLETEVKTLTENLKVANDEIDGLRSKVRGDLAKIQSGVASMPTTATVNKIKRDISEMVTTLGGVETDITGLTTGVAGAKKSAADAAGIARKATTDLGALKRRVDTTEADITDLKTDVAAVPSTAVVTKLQGDMTTVKRDIAGLTTGVAEAKQSAADAAGAAGKANTDVAALKRRVGATETDITGLKSDVAGLSGGATTTALTALSTKVNTVEGTANKAKTDITALTRRVGAAETDIDAAEADITALKAGGGGGEGDVTALTATVNAQGARLKVVEDTLDDVEIDMNDMDRRVEKLRRDLAAVGGGDDTPLPADSAAAIENLRFMLSRIGMVAIVSAEMAAARLRQTGNSGVIGARSYQGGSHPWHEGSFVNSARIFMSMHDHANFLDTVGLGEVSANMNGVEFWTRHNDYRMRTPDDKDSKYLALKALTYPDVPKEVADCGGNIQCGVTKMRKYFDAFSKQDTSIVNYKPYFKPVLCYLEGWWTVSEADDKLEDASVSDRHSNAADTWEELYNRFRYLTFLGRKNSNENLPFLPSRIWEMKNGYEPIVAQWQFRITCQPLKNDVELARFSVLPDLHVQLQSSSPMTRDQLADTRAARFALNQYVGTDKNRIEDAQYGPMSEDFLDSLMSQVSGLNNHGAGNAPALKDSVPDGTSEEIAYAFDADQSKNPAPLDMTYYSRYYSVAKAGAMGQSVRRRGFSDATLWVAQTTQPKVASQRFMHTDGTYSDAVRASYALPLEIVYLTPLSNWNPYNIEIHNQWLKPTEGGRNGHKTNPARAYDGASRRTYFITPVEFFAGFGESDAADTSAREVGVLDRNGRVRLCAASGHWIRFPYIQDVGQVVPYTGSRVRQRWPIAPVHIGTSVAWQELKALQAVVSTGDKTGVNAGLDIPVLNELRMVLTGGAGQTHEHVIRVDERRQGMLDNGRIPVWSTGFANGHKHKIAMKKDATTGEYYLWKCDDIDDVDRAVSECNHEHGPVIAYS